MTDCHSYLAFSSKDSDQVRFSLKNLWVGLQIDSVPQETSPLACISHFVVVVPVFFSYKIISYNHADKMVTDKRT